MKVVLELQDQPSNVRRITVRHDIVIGRGSDCNLRLSAPQVSRRHCFLRVGRESVSVTDLDSSNGTYIDGARITAGKRYDVADGAQLALGPIRFIIHTRTEVVAADSLKSKMAAGVTNETQNAEIALVSGPRKSFANDGSAASGRVRIADSDVPMDYNMEQGGDSSEPHEPTAELLDNPNLTGGLAELISPAPDPMDSRLEIIDFGRRLSEESLSGEESCAVTLGDVVGKPESVNDEEPQWESAIIDSSDSPDDLDVLSIADGSDVESGGDQKLPSNAEVSHDEGPVNSRLLIDDGLDTIMPQPFPDAVASGQKFVVPGDFLAVEVIDENLEMADAVVEEVGASPWFANDEQDAEEVNEVNAEPAQSADDEIDPELQRFLKGF